MAELVDALDSKSNVLKKTCRFEPGFGHQVVLSVFSDGTILLLGT